MTDSTKHKFDLHSQKGVAELLSQVRASALPAATKTTIRELVLKYAQKGGDVGVREELEQMLQGITLLAADESTTSEEVKTEEEVAKKEEPVPGGSFAGGRPVPSFVAPAVSSSEPEPNKEENPEPQPEPPAPEPIPEPEPVAETPAEPQPEPAPQPEPQPAPSGDILARIQAIKKEVIALVGNPVNLVNADNQVGQAYMSSLLDAMKKSNTGTQAEASEAMQKLEEAFVSVQEVARKLKEGEQGESESEEETPAEPEIEPTPEPEPIAETPAEPESEPAPEPVSEENTETETEVSEEKENADEKNEEETPAETEPVEKTLGGAPLRDIPMHGFGHKPEPLPQNDSVEDIPKPPPPPVAPAPAPEPEKEEKPEPEPEPSAPEPEPEPEVEKSESSRILPRLSMFGRKSSEKEEKPKPTPAPEPEKEEKPDEPVAPPPPPAPPTPEPEPVAETPAEPEHTEAVKEVESNVVKPSVTQVASPPKELTLDDELMAPEVTQGLELLLAEWKIFSRSGLFGTGPSGLDHPLYKQLKGMPMLTVAKGTFEGATEDIRQSMTDYINGWRYEQNITYQHTETFEHFLRRVVKRILRKTAG